MCAGRRPADLLLLVKETQSGAELRAAFSDTEDFVDLGLALSISSWTENMKPSFTKKLKLQSVLEGEPVEMRCKLTAFPPPTVLWFHNNRSIPKERRRRIYTNSSMHMHTTALVISGVKEKDSGSYKVMALNSEGSAESTASLLVSLREEQSANYLNLARLTHKAHEHVNTTAEQRKEQKFRVELRCVGSPFDKMSKAHRGKARSKHALVRTVYFRSAFHSKETESAVESKPLETASELAPSPPLMFDRPERFNDRFSDIYCDRRTGAQFSDKFSDRCSDRYSERFSDTESLHNEVRTKLSTLQKAVRQKKRLSVSTMSSSEFDLESVVSESSYADYIDKLRVKPASLPDVQHFNAASSLGETHRMLFQGTASSLELSRPHSRHSFEPQSRTRAIQIMKGELVETIERHTQFTSVGSPEETPAIESFDRPRGDCGLEQMSGSHPSVVSDPGVNATNVKMEPIHSESVFDSEKASYPPTAVTCRESNTKGPSQEEIKRIIESTRSKPLTEFFSETERAELSTRYFTSESLQREECGKVQRTLGADPVQSEKRLVSSKIKTWQHESPECEKEFDADFDVSIEADTQYMEPTRLRYPHHDVLIESLSPFNAKNASKVESNMAVTMSPSKSSQEQARRDGPKLSAVDQQQEYPKARAPIIAVRPEQVKEEVPQRMVQKSPKITFKASEVKEDLTQCQRFDHRLGSSPRLMRSTREETVTADSREAHTSRMFEEEEEQDTLRAQYERSLEVERIECEEKLLTLRIRKWQQGMRMSEDDLPMPPELQYMKPDEPVYTRQETVVQDQTGQRPTVPPRVKASPVDTHTEPSVSLLQKSPRGKSLPAEVKSEAKTTSTTENVFEENREDEEKPKVHATVSESRSLRAQEQAEQENTSAPPPKPRVEESPIDTQTEPSVSLLHKSIRVNAPPAEVKSEEKRTLTTENVLEKNREDGLKPKVHMAISESRSLRAQGQIEQENTSAPPSKPRVKASPVDTHTEPSVSLLQKSPRGKSLPAEVKSEAKTTSTTENVFEENREDEEKPKVHATVSESRSLRAQEQAEQENTSAPPPKPRVKASPIDTQTEPSVYLLHKSPRGESSTAEVKSEVKTTSTTEKMLFEKNKEDRELQLSVENLSELKCEQLVDEEEALTQRIMKWQQDVLMEQDRAMKEDSDWIQDYPAETSTEQKQPKVQHDLQPFLEKTAKEKFVLSVSADTEDMGLQLGSPVQDQGTKLQRECEEEALTQRILKWQEGVGGQEEPDWSLNTQCRQSRSTSPAHFTLPASEDQPHNVSSPTRVSKSSHHHPSTSGADLQGFPSHATSPVTHSPKEAELYHNLGVTFTSVREETNRQALSNSSELFRDNLTNQKGTRRPSSKENLPKTSSASPIQFPTSPSESQPGCVSPKAHLLQHNPTTHADSHPTIFSHLASQTRHSSIEAALQHDKGVTSTLVRQGTNHQPPLVQTTIDFNSTKQKETPRALSNEGIPTTSPCKPQMFSPVQTASGFEQSSHMISKDIFRETLTDQKETRRPLSQDHFPTTCPVQLPTPLSESKPQRVAPLACVHPSTSGATIQHSPSSHISSPIRCSPIEATLQHDRGITPPAIRNKTSHQSPGQMFSPVQTTRAHDEGLEQFPLLISKEIFRETLTDQKETRRPLSKENLPTISPASPVQYPMPSTDRKPHCVSPKLCLSKKLPSLPDLQSSSASRTPIEAASHHGATPVSEKTTSPAPPAKITSPVQTTIDPNEGLEPISERVSYEILRYNLTNQKETQRSLSEEKPSREEIRAEVEVTEKSSETRQHTVLSGVNRKEQVGGKYGMMQDEKSPKSVQRGVVKEEKVDESRDENRFYPKREMKKTEGESTGGGLRPLFMKETSSVDVKTGEMTEFFSQFKGDPLPTVSWLKDGHPLNHNPDYDIISKSNKSKLTVFYPTTDHEGKYDCVISNKHGKSICSATLKISDRRISKSSDFKQKVEETVQKESVTDKELQGLMEKETLEVPQAAVHRRVSSGEDFTLSSVEIRVTAATPIPEMMEEFCTVTPQAVTETTSEVSSEEGGSQHIKHKFTFSFDAVGEAPHIVVELENITCSEGATAMLECIITGQPCPDVTWYRDTVCLEVSSGKYTAQVNENVYRLYIVDFRPSDAGLYKCVARNQLGETASLSEVSLGDLKKAVPFLERDIDDESFKQFGETSDKPVLLHQTALSHLEDVFKQTEEPALSSAAKGPRFRPACSEELPTISGCGLQASAAVINISQIKQVFESDSVQEGLISPPSPEDQRKIVSPEEFLPLVAISSNSLEQVTPFKESHIHGEHTDQDTDTKTASPGLLKALQTTSTLIPGSMGSSQPSEGAAVTEYHNTIKQFVDEVQSSPDLIKPRPLKASQVSKAAIKPEIVSEEVVSTFDQTSSFIPFEVEKVLAINRSVRPSAPVERGVKSKTFHETIKTEIKRGAAEKSSFVPVCPERLKSLEGLTDTGKPIDREECTAIPSDKQGSEEAMPIVGDLVSKGKEYEAELILVPELSMDSGVFVSLPDSHTEGTGELQMTINVDIKDEDKTQDSQPQEVSTKLQTDIRDASHVQCAEFTTQRKEEVIPLPTDKTGEAAVIISPMEEEEVTFGAVYNFYNPPTDWGRPLSPESEMSIEVGSTVSEDLPVTAERFFTPGSSSETSHPIAESLHTPKSLSSFHSLSSDSPCGFLTPQEFPLSPAEHMRATSGESSDVFFSPVNFLASPVDESIKANRSIVSETPFLTRAEGSLGLSKLKEKVQGIPPAFLKPLTKKRVLENDSLAFNAEVFGQPFPEIRWFCNKTQIMPDNRIKTSRDGDSISLLIDNITKADQGEYICEAVNYVGEARSVALVVVVSQDVQFMPAPPAVTHQHVMEFDVEEDDLSRSPSPQEILLEVELDENEVKEFEKQIKIITIPEYTADNKSMIISLDVLPSLYEEAGVDFVTQEHDSLKIDFEVTEMPPRFINPICDMETPEGTTVIFECSLMGMPSPVVSWFRGDRKIPHHSKKFLPSYDGDNHFLKLCKVSTHDSGVYTCRAINTVGETLCRASLMVINAKAFSGKTRGRELTAVSLGSAKVQPQKFDLVVGNTSFDGEEVSEIELEFEFEQEADDSQRAVRLVANTDSETSEQGHKYVSVNFDVFAEPAKDDKVDFKGKSTEMCSFQFQVTEMPPKCVIPLTNVTAAVGTPAILQCLVKGKPNPTAEWFKDGDQVTDSRCIIQEKTVGHFNLLITNVTPSDAGEYKCFIQNSAGYTESSALLKVF